VQSDAQMKKFKIYHKKVIYYIFENSEFKICRTDDSSYNYNFNKINGTFYRWGKTNLSSDDPLYCPLGPEILDIEVSINGCYSNCAYCYKNNSYSKAYNMNFKLFKSILDKIPPVLTQVAFGITDENANPDLLEMMRYCNHKGFIPNLTISGRHLSDKLANEFKNLLGAIAVSAHPEDKELCYNSIIKLINLGARQVNMHLVISQQNLPFIITVLQDIKTDKRLEKLNAVVFLSIKPKGRAKYLFTSLNQEQFNHLLSICKDSNLPYGFDSCSAPKFASSIFNGKMNDAEMRRLLELTESCESSLFSAYIDVHGNYWPCSFAEGEKDINPIEIIGVRDFTQELWNSKSVNIFRTELLRSTRNGIRRCLLFNSIN